MKRIRSTYHTLDVLHAADPKLRKAIIANCNQETLKSIIECPLNDLRGNIPLSAFSKRNLRTHKNSLRKVADNSISLSAKRKVISPSPAAACYITHSRGTFIPLELTMLHKMYLVSSNLSRKLKATNKQPSKKSENCRRVFTISGLR